MRKIIYDTLFVVKRENTTGGLYHLFLVAVAAFSMVPLAFKETTPYLRALDTLCVFIFMIDYVLRFLTADFKYQTKYRKQGAHPFLSYPFSPMALVDLVSILPSLPVLSGNFRLLRMMRIVRVLRVFRTLRVVQYSKSARIIAGVFQKSKRQLAVVGTLAVAYVLTSAFLVFNVEPDSFDNFFDAVYWATISLTTVGYGDIYPVTDAGKLITIVSSIFGIAVVALPAGIITAGYMEEIDKGQDGEDAAS